MLTRWAKFVAFWTAAVIAAGNVYTLCVPCAGTSSQQTLVPIHALVGVLVEIVAPVAFTLEAPDGVHAGAVLARAGHQLTLVDLGHAAGHRIDNEAWSGGAAQLTVLGGSSRRTFFARQAPGGAHRATTHHARLRL